jgi:hypothetical protein
VEQLETLSKRVLSLEQTHTESMTPSAKVMDQAQQSYEVWQLQARYLEMSADLVDIRHEQADLMASFKSKAGHETNEASKLSTSRLDPGDAEKVSPEMDQAGAGDSVEVWDDSISGCVDGKPRREASSKSIGLGVVRGGMTMIFGALDSTGSDVVSHTSFHLAGLYYSLRKDAPLSRRLLWLSATLALVCVQILVISGMFWNIEHPTCLRNADCPDGMFCPTTNFGERAICSWCGKGPWRGAEERTAESNSTKFCFQNLGTALCRTEGCWDRTLFGSQWDETT